MGKAEGHGRCQLTGRKQGDPILHLKVTGILAVSLGMIRTNIFMKLEF